MGTILQRKIVPAKAARKANSTWDTDWVNLRQKVLLNEHTHFVFRGGPGFRSVDASPRLPR